MNKQQLIKNLSVKTGIPQSKASELVDSLVETIAHEIVNGGIVKLSGLGTFSTIFRKNHLARNPRTGESVQVAARRVPKLRFSNAIKNSLKSEDLPF